MKTVARLALHAAGCLSVSLLMAAPGHAVPCEDYPLLEESRLGFLPTTRLNDTFTRAGDLVYASGYYQGFQVFDISDPVQPALLADVPVGFNPGFDSPRVLVHQTMGYLSGAWHEIPAFDLTDPAAPVPIDPIPTLFEVRALAAEGDHLYAATFGRREFANPDSTVFFVIDVSDPTAPVTVAQYWENHDRAHCMEARDDVVFLGATQGLHAFDVSDPLALVELDYLDVDYPFQLMQLEGALLYAAAGGVLHVVDVSDPTDLVLLSSTDTRTSSPRGLSVHDGTAVMSAGTAGLRIIDVSDPAQPSAVASWPSVTSCFGLTVESERVCVLKGDEFLVVSPDYPAPVAPLGTIQRTYLPSRLLMSGGRLYVLDGTELLIYDTSDPAAPVLLGVFDNGESYNRLSLDGSVLYLADLGNGGVIAIDVSDPTHPRKLSILTLEQSYSIHARDGRVAVGPRSGVVQLFDTSDPSAPVLLGTHVSDTTYRAYGVAIVGDHVYLTTGTTSVLDISDPTDIHTVASLQTGFGLDLVADGPWVYTGDDQAMKVLRFTAPATLELVADAPIPTRLEDLHRDGDLLFLACRRGGVHMFDLTDPTAPIHAGGIPADQEAYAVAADAGVVALYNRNASTNPQSNIQLYPAACTITGVVQPDRPPLVVLSLTAAPNPFNPRVTFSFTVPRAGWAELAVFDLRGRRVATILDGHLDAGSQRLQWNGQDAGGRPAASGTYVARLRSGDATASRSVMLVR